MGLTETRALEERYLMRTYKRGAVDFVRGEGVHLYDADGKEYLDFLAGISVCSLGHCHPAVVNAVTRQTQQLMHVSNLFYTEPMAELAQRLSEVGQATGERVWRMPLGPEYDKLIDSQFADMKNTGGRHGGSITAAQFLQRFVDETPWAHLDIAGTAMGAPKTDINQSWGSGYGVRLLDRLVAEHYEAGR